MTLAQFIRHLERQGGDLTRWPDRARQQALDLVRQNPAAGQALERARRLDGFLRANDPAADVADARVQRLMARVQGRMGAQVCPPEPLWTRLVDLLSDMLETRPRLLLPRFVAPLLVAGLLGVWVGQEWSDQSAQEAPVTQVSALLDMAHLFPVDL